MFLITYWKYSRSLVIFWDMKTQPWVTIFSKPTRKIFLYNGQKFSGALELQISSYK